MRWRKLPAAYCKNEIEGRLLRYASSPASSRTEVRSGAGFFARLVSAASISFLPRTGLPGVRFVSTRLHDALNPLGINQFYLLR